MKEESILFRTDGTTKQWLADESAASGRSVTFLVQHAVDMWRRRLIRERQTRAKKAVTLAGKTQNKKVG